MHQWYDRIASAYDDHRLPLSPRLAEVLVRHAGITDGDRVLDVGTGTGNVAIAAVRRVGGHGLVVAVDLSPVMLAQARRKAGSMPIEFREMDVEALQFEDGTFDVVLAGLLPEVGLGLSEMYRVLRAGGRVALSTYTSETHEPLARFTWSRLERHGIMRAPAPSPPGPATEAQDLATLLGRAGFQEISVIHKPHTHWLECADDWWTYMCRSTRWGPALARLDPERLESLRTGILGDMGSLRTAAGIQVDASALIGVGARDTRPLLQHGATARREPMMRINFRSADRRDAAPISVLARRTWVHAFGHSVSAEEQAVELEKRSEEYFRSAMNKDTILVAQLGSEIVGYALFGDVNIPEIDVQPGDQQLHQIYVASELHGRGVGHDLLSAALKHPRLGNARRVFLQVWDKNVRAIRLYESLGFRTVGVTRFTIGSARVAEDLVMLRLPSGSKDSSQRSGPIPLKIGLIGTLRFARPRSMGEECSHTVYSRLPR